MFHGWLHDEWLAIVAAAVGRFDMVEDALIDYRQHGANVVGARELRFGGKVGRVLQPRTARNARLLVRSENLVDRLRVMPGVPAGRVRLAEAKLAHERRRSRLPAARIRRLPAVVSGVLRGRYHRFGRGVADAVRDLMQPV